MHPTYKFCVRLTPRVAAQMTGAATFYPSSSAAPSISSTSQIGPTRACSRTANSHTPRRPRAYRGACASTSPSFARRGTTHAYSDARICRTTNTVCGARLSASRDARASRCSAHSLPDKSTLRTSRDVCDACACLRKSSRTLTLRLRSWVHR